ncbi:hypothetical protein OFN63_36805, partial [Escherichia coli]|nr:hypothetical protein [Escherichia coli]
MTANDAAYGALMQACVRAGDLKAAYGVLTAAQEAGVRLTPVLFTTLIVGAIHAGEYERAWEVYDHMRRYHCEPDAVA